MSIDRPKLQSIYAECVATSKKHHLSRSAFQSLLGKLLYIHKCNRMLALFRANPSAKRIHLTSDFHKDLDWFLTFLPSFNGVTFIHKADIPNIHTLHIDASLTGLGGVWNQEVYATPIFIFYDCDLKIVHLEMLNLVISLKLWAHKWAHFTVKFYCDNLAVVQVVTTGRTNDQWLALALRNIWLIEATHDITLNIEHIKGSYNIVADMLSRIYSDKSVNHQLFKHVKNTCTWHNIAIQFFNLNYNI